MERKAVIEFANSTIMHKLIDKFGVLLAKKNWQN